VLGVVAVTVPTVGEAVDLLLSRAGGVAKLTTKQIEITADAAQIPVGADGEALTMPTPVTCTIWPDALRGWVPRDRPGIPAPKPPVNWARLRRLAGGRRLPAEVAG